MIDNDSKQITEYGKSMYGGWYANFFDKMKCEHTGTRAKTLTELCSKIGVSRTALTRDVVRVDN